MRIKENRRQHSRKEKFTGDEGGTVTQQSSRQQESRKVEDPGREAHIGESGKIKLHDILDVLADLVGKTKVSTQNCNWKAKQGNAQRRKPASLCDSVGCNSDESCDGFVVHIRTGRKGTRRRPTEVWHPYIIRWRVGTQDLKWIYPRRMQANECKDQKQRFEEIKVGHAQ